MKHTLLIIVICALSFGCNRRGCTDELAINYDSKSKKDDGNCIYPVDETPKDTFFISSVIAVPQQKVVLLEEFTGVYCYTCPLGHLVADSIIEEFPGQIAPLNIHSVFYGIYDDPNVLGNSNDFRTKDGDSIVSMLGGIISVPSGSIDRVIASGEAQVLTQNRDNWKEYVETRLTEVPPVNIEIKTEFDETTRNLQIVVVLKYTEGQTPNNYLSVVIAEDDVEDKQLVDTVVVIDYKHPHILRDAITDVKGDQIDVSLVAGLIYVRVYNYQVPTGWNSSNVEIVAYVHEKDNTWNVLQAATKNINE
ncbi:MAG: Omp28-related outer membrane protein [Flavobacteriales bacterium]|nr:Omp28-related outer membrane protein [Flavobacteriales bacterium]